MDLGFGWGRIFAKRENGRRGDEGYFVKGKRTVYKKEYFSV